jgi:hypothetical protein
VKVSFMHLLTAPESWARVQLLRYWKLGKGCLFTATFTIRPPSSAKRINVAFMPSWVDRCLGAYLRTAEEMFVCFAWSTLGFVCACH